MHSEWMKVMLAEIERKQAEAQQQAAERRLRTGERQDADKPGAGDGRKRPRKRS
jgi:plasmid stabilization system protein ParE